MRVRRTSGLAVSWLAAVAILIAEGAAPSRAQPIAAPFSDSELIRGFVLTVFGAEVESARNRATTSVVKKFVGPVRYRLVSTAERDWRGTVRAFLSSLSDSVLNLTLVETPSTGEADLVIYLVDRVDYAATIRRTVWPGVDTAFLEDNACSAVLAARPTGIERANIYLVADEGFASLSHCLVEEVAQSLGPANDSDLLPDSIFNDDSRLNVFALFDWFILNMLYDSRVRPGMTEAQVLPVLPSVIRDVRARVPEALGAGGHLGGHGPAAR